MATLDRPATMTPEQLREVIDRLTDIAAQAADRHQDVLVATVAELVGIPDTPTEGWIRSTEAADLLGVSRNTVKKWARTGYLRGSRRDPDGWWRIPRASVLRVAAVESEMDAMPEMDDRSAWRD